MASVENPSNGNNGNNQGEGHSLSASVPAVFHPPYPSMRNGPHDSSDQSSQGSRSHRSYRQSDPSMAATSHSKDKMVQRDHSFSRPNKAGHYETYYVQNDGREYETYQPVERREGSSRTDDRRADNGHHYNSYSRDGPSPGRGYTQNYPHGGSEHMRQPPAHRFHRPADRMPYQYQQPTQPGSPPFRNAPVTNGKRKADPSTPEGPRLISNQSSDDSINALLPPKRARSNNNFSDSVALMKSFTPLSPIHSRTFSRDEAIDMPRFMDSRGSAEGLRIFQSWSSGNTPPQDDQSSLDVRYCYNDWHGPGRRSSVKMSSIKEEKVERQQSSGSHTPPVKTSRGQAPPQERYPSSREHTFGRGGGHGSQSDQFAPPNSYNDRTPANSQYCQPLHPEDRFGPFSDQLSRRVPEYNQEVQPRYWQEGSAPYQQYPSSRRGDPEEHNSPARRGTPPASNGWNRYEEYPPSNSSRYEHPAMHSRPPQYETWSDNRPYPEASYGNRPPIEQQPREYTGRHLQSAVIETGPDGLTTSMRTATGILLLSLPEDKISLSETLCIVRENIEVFIATDADVKAPAPGRKRPVVVGQVGLRCIHCRVATHQSEKVKRAVCFPSSIKRIYRTVIDMKLDHFKACRFVPPEFKMKLEQLKATNARSTGTTMQYFVQAANRMGMVDGGHGIRFCRETTDSAVTSVTPGDMPPITGNSRSAPMKQEISTHQKLMADGRNRALDRMPSHNMSFSLSMDLSLSGASAGSSGKISTSESASIRDDIPTFEGKTSLSCPEDKNALSPLRCFLRENVYAFSATAEDIAVRTPTTFSVVAGQVGIGCVHCYHLPAKERSNRAVCFPFSIGRIYQSVADIQRFHVGECKMIPHDVKQKFLELQRASTKGSKGLATRQYWVTSAKKRGLVDTSNGIRFARDPSVPLEKAVSLDILAQVANDVTTASKPLVLPEDQDEIAEFIYVVMNQLQPCRFTEADRNKRRLKDVGCIGVECKHCAGKVDGRKFFWSSVNAVESNFVSVHTHMMECKAIPSDLKEDLAQLKTLRKEHTAKLKTGSQKAFFARVWKRLHAEGENNSNAEEKKPSSAYGVPPHVAVPSQLQKSPSSPQGAAFNIVLSNVSSPTNSFAEQMNMNSSPISSERPSLKAERVFNGPSSPSEEKFPMLPLTLPSSAGSRNSPQLAEQYPRHESV